MDEGPYFIDANVPMYAVGVDHPLKGPSVAVLSAVARGDVIAVTDAEVHQEILHRYSTLGDRRRAIEVSDLFLRAVPEVLAVTRADVEAAGGLLAAHGTLPVRDAIHLAVMTRHGVSRIVTADRHFDALPGVVRVDPGDWGTRAGG
jgi:predicted nucleic acid-binding protein